MCLALTKWNMYIILCITIVTHLIEDKLAWKIVSAKLIASHYITLQWLIVIY